MWYSEPPAINLDEAVAEAQAKGKIFNPNIQYRHCDFKNNNPKYVCPRTGDRYQPAGDCWYCAYHDTLAEDRCQQFTFRKSGIQCPLKYTEIDEVTGRKYCGWHRLYQPPSLLNAGMTERVYQWLANVESEDSLLEDVNGSATVSDHVDTNSEAEEDTESWPKTVSEQGGRRPLVGCWPFIVSDEPATEAEQGVESPGDIDAKSGIGEGNDEIDESQAGVHLHTRLGREPERYEEPEPQPDHLAALYLLCNICLEEHNAADMVKIESCGHQYYPSCLDDLLRRKVMRKYNCTGCRAWLESQQQTQA